MRPEYKRLYPIRSEISSALKRLSSYDFSPFRHSKYLEDQVSFLNKAYDDIFSGGHGNSLILVNVKDHIERIINRLDNYKWNIRDYHEFEALASSIIKEHSIVEGSDLHFRFAQEKSNYYSRLAETIIEEGIKGIYAQGDRGIYLDFSGSLYSENFDLRDSLERILLPMLKCNGIYSNKNLPRSKAELDQWKIELEKREQEIDEKSTHMIENSKKESDRILKEAEERASAIISKSQDVLNEVTKNMDKLIETATRRAEQSLIEKHDELINKEVESRVADILKRMGIKL